MVSFGVFSLSGGVWVSFVVVGEGELAGWVGAGQVSSRKLVEVAS